MKKKHLLGVLLTLCLVVGLLPAPALAASDQVALKLGSAWCAIDTQVVQVDESNAQVTPYAVQFNGGGYTLLPIRRVLEAFGGSVEWVPATGGVLCTLNGRQVELAPGSAQATVDGKSVAMDVPAEARNDRTFVPVRFVSENLGLSVSYEPTNQIVVVSAAPVDQNNLTSLTSVKALTAKLASIQPAVQPVTYQEGSYALPSGTVSAKVIAVNMSDPRVSVRSAIVGNRLNATADFGSIVSYSGGAAAVINANFFESYEDVKDPIGPVMVGGNFVYGNSGSLTSLGITADGRMYYAALRLLSGHHHRWRRCPAVVRL
ncbi:copper amine oxidase N-terminal domain-containing protein [Intestinimonas sp.]|uniref:copper amine oxidase N-terminal domain-containing protein n=1 Tax=Intestinimonas sp. TaxID=1965293 RepID=UPI00261A7B58|nr:copper amine oxidase N-terminal domain-containing protein [Intestinimonas sp.]